MIVLDTHAWVWLASEPGKLSPPARRAVEASDAVLVSAVSVWEVVTMVLRGRLRLDRSVPEWVRQALALPSVQPVDLTAGMPLGVEELAASGFGGDPADRLITSTALARRCPLVTKDGAIAAYAEHHPTLVTIW